MFCTKCGMQLSDEWNTCPACGRKIEESDTAEQIEEKEIEISAGELTVSGQRKLITVIRIKGNQLTIENYLNTKLDVEPVVNTFLTSSIERMKYKTCMVFRKLHQIRFISAGVLFLLFLLLGELYFLGISVLLVMVNCFSSLQWAMEIQLKDERKIRIYYIDKDEVMQVEQMIHQINQIN